MDTEAAVTLLREYSYPETDILAALEWLTGGSHRILFVVKPAKDDTRDTLRLFRRADGEYIAGKVVELP